MSKTFRKLPENTGRRYTGIHHPKTKRTILVEQEALEELEEFGVRNRVRHRGRGKSRDIPTANDDITIEALGEAKYKSRKIKRNWRDAR